MHVRALHPGDEPAVEAFLFPRLDSSMFLLSNLRNGGLQDSGRRSEGTYVAAFEADEIIAVAALFWTGNIILQAPLHLEAILRELSRLAPRAVAGLIGPDEQVRAAAAHLSIPRGDDAVQMNSAEGLYALELRELIVPPDLAAGRVRARRSADSDLDLMMRWRIAYCVEALGSRDGQSLRDRCTEDVATLHRLGRLWLLEKDGRPVAHTAFNSALPEAVQIGGVWTPPEFRGRGYARAVVAASLLDARADGAGRAILFTGDDNPAAISAYRALGFQRVGDYRLLLLSVPRRLHPHPPG